MKRLDLAKMIDHTLLKVDATPAQVEAICKEAREYGFASVCVNSCYARRVTDWLAGSDVKTCCVVGFPLGAMSTPAKAAETAQAVADGAKEIDMVVNLGAVKSGDFAAVESDIRAVVEAAGDAIVKVILETCLLTDDEKVKSCTAAARAGARFVKTSTGFSTGGATAADIALMRRSIPEGMFVKASGGIRTQQDAVTMIEAGASRIGASSGVAIVMGEAGAKTGY